MQLLFLEVVTVRDEGGEFYRTYKSSYNNIYHSNYVVFSETNVRDINFKEYET